MPCKATPSRTLRVVDMSRYDEECRAYWEANRFHLCTQDKRITDAEWQVLANLMTRLFGLRSVL